ncbi:FBD-associated F-box protein At1g60410-like isoform X3 [Rhodamnia argentea]|uniref:FBD-associated F-box protein At1g60410-like isoform X3 n=1 Tax=Rhodamnia argentea TaxID=178133 RepID=A0A8B8Q582_9MYRT|nr:FBD-associated F-box protein At1g60410-like isoform X3 [Rhodamnia argentea]
MDGDEESCLPANTVEHASPEHEERNKDLQDMISELPHEILVSILSLMTFKEAVRTSVLSRRWKKLWSYTTGSLDFEDSKAEQDISHNTKSLGAGRFKFIGWVNRMLNSHQGSRIREFRDGLEIPQFPMLFNLRYLTWLVQTSDTASLLGLTSLIEAAPFLHHFELKLEWTEPWRRRNAKRVNATPNQYLKEVKILGFRGYAIDSEIISYLLERATMLEEIVVDPHPHACLTEGTFMEEKQAARKKAEQLKPKLPHAAKLIIL